MLLKIQFLIRQWCKVQFQEEYMVQKIHMFVHVAILIHMTIVKSFILHNTLLDGVQIFSTRVK